MQFMTPFSIQVDVSNGSIPAAALVQSRRLSDMRGLYAYKEAEETLAAQNPLIYEVYLAYDMPPVEGQLAYSTTVIQAGKVSEEYFMTKGHYHSLGNRGELYYGLKGEGLFLMQAETGEVHAEAMCAGTGAYVPPYWGHRTVNTGSEPFVFLAVYPADAGYNYQSIAQKGFAALVVERGGKTELVKNPRWL